MTTAARVSIVIPTYNHAAFLRAALDSVLAQTYHDWEAIVVNNFSEDDTVALVASYQDPRIRCVNFANHGVIAASRNHGVASTTAPIVAFLDSDDLWYPTKLEKCLALIDQDYDLVCHGEKWVGPGTRWRDVYYGPEPRASFERLLYEGNCISTSAVLVKRTMIELVGGFAERPAAITAEDYDFWLKLARAGVKMGFVHKILGEYLIHGGNQSRASLRNMHAVMEVVEHHMQADRPAGFFGRLRMRRRRALVYYGGARGLQDSGEYWAAWCYFIKAFLQFPLVPKFYAAMLLNAFGRHP